MKRTLNLWVLILMLIGSNISAQTIFQEDFESFNFPPNGWIIQNNGAGNTWVQNTTATNAFSGTRSMICRWNATNAADAWAYTPKLYFNTNPVTISFRVKTGSTFFNENLKLTVGSDTTVSSQSTVLLDSSTYQSTGFTLWSATYQPTSAGYFRFAFNCYSNANQLNVIVDSINVYQNPVACSLPITPGVTVSTSQNVCTNTPFGLDVINYSPIGATITYTWQFSTDSVNWNTIQGAISDRYVHPGISTTTYFRRGMSCNGSPVQYSTALKFVTLPFLTCYCSPNTNINLGGSLTSASIDSVNIIGTSFIYGKKTVPANFYTLNSDTTNIICLNQGATYSIFTRYSSNANSSLWIDYDQNGIFDSTEWVRIQASGTSSTFSFTIPQNATLGTTGMRIRSRTNTQVNGASNSCTNFTTGETEDYLVKICPTISCSSTINAGSTYYKDTSVCPNTSFTLSVVNGTSGLAVTYQWQSSTDNINWIDIVGETGIQYANTSGISSATYYRRKMDCSGNIVFSSSLYLQITKAAFCICTPNSGTTLHGGTSPFIDSVNIPVANLYYGAQGNRPTNGYSLVSTSVSLMQANNYTLNTFYSGSAIGSVWFDWNQDGKFDSSEWFRVNTTGNTGTITFLVPANAQVGTTIMRVRARGSGNTNGKTDACTQFFSGETKDFVVTIIAGVPCTGTPIGGQTQASLSTVCPGQSFSLIVNNSSSGVTNLNYQWQFSNDGINYFDLNGETNIVLNVNAGITVKTYYRRKVDCGGSVAFSTPAVVDIKPTNLCPCSPITGTTLNSTNSLFIDSVNIVGTNMVYKSTLPRPTNFYTLVDDSTLTPTLLSGSSYILYTKMTANSKASVWYDWNMNGIFEPNEYDTIIGTSGRSSAVININVPSSVSIGKLLMRIRSHTQTSVVLADTSACTRFAGGDTKDFLLNVIAGTPCTGKPNPGTITSSISPVCPTKAILLNVSGSTANVTGLTYQWYSAQNGGAFQALPGETYPSLILNTGLLTTTDFIRVTTCGTDTAATPVFTQVINPSFLCPCNPINGTTLHNTTTNLPTIDSVNLIGTNMLISKVPPPTGGYTQHLDSVTMMPTLNIGTVYTLYVGFSANATGSVWVDWNQNGLFETTEWYQVAQGVNSGTIQISVPSGATLGKTLLRIRSAGPTVTNNTAPNACTTFFSGETEDFLINIAAGVVCSGQPVGGTTTMISPTILCSGGTFTLGVTGATNTGNGLTYQWQSSTDGGINWNDLTGETGLTYTGNGLTVSTCFRRMIDCGGFNDFSTSYCVSPAGGTANFPLTEGFEGLNTVGGAVLPACWKTAAGTNLTRFYSAQAAIRNRITARTGTKFVYSRMNSSSWLFTPPLILTAGTTYTYYYYYRPTDTVTSFNIKTYVGTVADSSSMLTSTILGTISSPNDTSVWKIAAYTFTPTTTDVYFFAINSVNRRSTTSYVMYDDFGVNNYGLPVIMQSFTGKKTSEGNALQWITTKETNNRGYYVEKSTNGVEFSVIDFVPTKANQGNSSSAITYSYIDKKDVQQVCYYRIKQVDLNGKSYTSDIVKLADMKMSEAIYVYPNPAKSILNVQFRSTTSTSVKVLVTDVTGKLLREFTQQAVSGENNVQINLSGLSSGSYFLKIVSNSGQNFGVSMFNKQ